MNQSDGLTLEPPNPWNPRNLIYIVLAAIVFIGIWKKFTHEETVSNPPATVVEAKVNPIVAKEEKVDATINTPQKTVKVYKESAKARLTLPKDILDSSTKVITASSVVTESERPTEVTSVLDTNTGETTTFVTPKQYPWFALENKGEVNIDYILKTGSNDFVIRATARENFVNIKGIHLGGVAQIDSTGEGSVGVGATYKW